MFLGEILEFSGIVAVYGAEVGTIDHILSDVLQVLGVRKDLLEAVVMAVRLFNLCDFAFIVDFIYVFNMLSKFI